MNPREDLWAFMQRQPVMIRENIFTFAALAFSEQAAVAADAEAAARKCLDDCDGFMLVQRVAHVAASLDLFFARGVSLVSAIDALPIEVRETEPIRRLVAQRPLRERHLRQAAKDWATLRQTTLSVEALLGFEATLMGA